MTKRRLLFLIIFIVFVFADTSAQNQKSNPHALVYFKSTTGKYWTKSQLDSFLLVRTNIRFKLIPQILGVEKHDDTLIYKYNLTIDDVPVDLNNRSWIGQPLPDFSLIDVDGNEIDLGDLKGKPLVINFWFATCVPCIAEMPVLNQLKEKYANTDVVFLSMTFEKRSIVINFLKQHSFNFTAISDAKEYCNRITRLYPLTLFVNKEGIIQSAEHIMAPLFNYEITKRIDELDPGEFEKNIDAIE
ncbi:MAG TPA: TlpA disulfide reductase family protein [Hanamia sp.]|nr:TlpA disulfide reductase family protein [Hanamia sp.]